MKTLVIGGGGREHALAWRLRNSPSVTAVYAAPGNPGIAEVAECYSTTDYVHLAEHLSIDLTVVGPEVPLVAGVVETSFAGALWRKGSTSSLRKSSACALVSWIQEAVTRRSTKANGLGSGLLPLFIARGMARQRHKVPKPAEQGAKTRLEIIQSSVA